MSKFCGNCGAELGDDATICVNCGWKSEAVAETETINAETAPEQSSSESSPADDGKKPDKKKTAILIGGIAVVVIAAIVGFILLIGAIFGGGGAQGALNNYDEVMKNPTTKNVEKLAPEKYWESFVEDDDSNFNDVDEVHEYFVENLEDAIEYFEDEFGDNIRISFKIEKEKDVKSSTLDDAKDLLKDHYDIPKKDIKKMVKLEVLLKIKGSEDEDEEETTMYAIQIGNNWYVCSANGDLMSFN